MEYSKAREIEIQDKVSDYYENVRYGRSYSKLYQLWWTSKMLSFIAPVNLKGKLLDNGCGIGTHFEELAKYSGNIIGMDLSAQMIIKARSRIKNVLLGNSEQLPFKNNNFNLVFSRSLLHHLPDPKRAIAEIYRVLADGGEAVFSDTNRSIISDLPRKVMNKEGEHFAQSHKNFSDKEFLNVISSKLKIDKVYYFGFIAYPALGFPDVADIFKFVPFKDHLAKSLIKLDEFISQTPVIRTQSWGIIVKASKNK
jgi:ubiquinone/menaquinone biosynthesis C-methylase UbiE